MLPNSGNSDDKDTIRNIICNILSNYRRMFEKYKTLTMDKINLIKRTEEVSKDWMFF